MKTYFNQLLSTFQKNTVTTTDKLIKYLLVDIGRKCLEKELTTDRLDPAYEFWYRLDEVSNGFIFDEACQDQKVVVKAKQPKNNFAQEKDLLVAEFFKYSYEEAIEELVLAVYEWLLCCQMSEYKNNEETEQDAKHRFCLDFALEMGLV